MTSAERTRRSRLRSVDIASQVRRIVRAFEGVSDEARDAFREWLKRRK
jgi:hypothetical protein